MAEFVGCDQATVSRIERGQEPSGPVGRMLEVLLAEVTAGRIKPKPGSAPSEHGAAA
ncbi:hypothetical protein HJG44_21930 [Enterovirga sp. DB1703]|uniref:Uncharacterized protein n=2 Tax=Enterovirga aerilata TaxID=2730920 RepID=A0A849IFM7_9HYPH|nr:hypothetical protein [Enterovirga sp. DB1703]